MQDGAPPPITLVLRTSSKITSQMNASSAITFVIFGPYRSPDINPCNFWLCGDLKHFVSRDIPRTLPDFNDMFLAIQEHIVVNCGTCYLTIPDGS
ncbi:hypothetical protein AVEN_231565-1 [Araneus ventricosus]|uniref:Uncharacterized protein n=1 Tax=Araneus ventricosus TaxID=182803 RepID=A0A4Y2KJ35_ARAVE|nr:hypothetical protein AVEN_231565-1 [Araneus ventricosus]